MSARVWVWRENPHWLELQVRITKQLVADKVGALLKKSDLSKFIL